MFAFVFNSNLKNKYVVVMQDEVALQEEDHLEHLSYACLNINSQFRAYLITNRLLLEPYSIFGLESAYCRTSSSGVKLIHFSFPLF